MEMLGVWAAFQVLFNQTGGVPCLLLERGVYVVDRLGDLWSAIPTEDGQLFPGGKLQLRLADLKEVAASLHEGIDVRKYG